MEEQTPLFKTYETEDSFDQRYKRVTYRINKAETAYDAAFVLLCTVLPICSITLITIAVLKGAYTSTAIGAFLLLLSVFYIWRLPYFVVKRRWKEYEKNGKPACTTLYYEDCFTIENGLDTRKFEYKDITYIEKNDDGIYMRYKDKIAVSAPYSAFVIGDPDGLFDLISSKANTEKKASPSFIIDTAFMFILIAAVIAVTVILSLNYLKI